MSIRKKPAVLLAGLLAVAQGVFCPAHASAWSREHRQLFVISRVDYFNADLGLVSVDDVGVPGRFERLEAYTYLEYGLTDAVMIGGKAFYGTSWLSRGADVETVSGLSEIEGFAQLQVFRDGYQAVAVKAAVGAPANFYSGVRPELRANGVDADFAGLYGRTFLFPGWKAFAAVETGFRKRFSASADQVRLLTTIGIEPSRRWTILIDTFSVMSLRNARENGVDYDVVKLQPSVVFRLNDRFSLQAGVNEEVAGRHLDRGRTVFAGVRTTF